ncbi:hypothetical protein MG293_010311 [Ovis ammon polii]|uniref:Uncharacterized protein n=1 Tax=Ovis ammon polii TaxID=230172 RepID=A0AAD4U631_OVIAM|nr:hypothetical protein MG293_010311 [Ovis ammon polii]
MESESGTPRPGSSHQPDALQTGKDFPFGLLPMQMCEDSGSDISGTEHLLLIGKHAQHRAAGSQPRALSAPWEPEPQPQRAGAGFSISRGQDVVRPQAPSPGSRYLALYPRVSELVTGRAGSAWLRSEPGGAQSERRTPPQLLPGPSPVLSRNRHFIFMYVSFITDVLPFYVLASIQAYQTLDLLISSDSSPAGFSAFIPEAHTEVKCCERNSSPTLPGVPMPSLQTPCGGPSRYCETEESEHTSH